MTEIPWYEPLTGEELEGKHVHVIFTHGSMDGRLNAQGSIDYWAKGHSVKYVQILKQSDIGDWYAVEGVESVTLVWDESEWEQILADDTSKADAIVVNGHLFEVTNFTNRYWFNVESPDYPDGVSIPETYVSCALRRRSKLPTKPGYYQPHSGGIFRLTDSGEWLYLANNGEWWPFGAIKEFTSPAQFMPLTPIHFENERS